VRNDAALFAQPAKYEGVDLIVRPDVVERLHSIYGVLIQELRVVWRDRMPDSQVDA